MTAPRSRDMNAAVPGAFYAAGSGTSRAAPLVAGACALLLECRGATATWANLKQILEDTADTTGLVIPSLGFGFGSLRVANPSPGPMPVTDACPRHEATDTGTEPSPGPVHGTG